MPVSHGANRARILVTVARSASSPIAAVAGSNYHLSHLTFSLDNASEAGGTCVGCTYAAAILYQSTVMYSVAGAGGLGSEAVPIRNRRAGSGHELRRDQRWERHVRRDPDGQQDLGTAQVAVPVS